MKTIEVKLNLELDLFIDSIINAIEDSSYYWMCPIPTKNLTDRLLNGDEIPICDYGENPRIYGVLSMETIARGIEKSISEAPKAFYHIVSGLNDMFDDDMFLQLCVLGELTFA